ncbi:MAG: hypothetical protein VX320_06505 [Candidatus Thermoplasmatota archaeon]|nr:hypothetical protein [Candidatus Thermoplasmatota archaeon]
MSGTSWPKRLLISGAVILVLSSVLIWVNWDDFVSAMDPENNNVAKVEGGGEETVDLDKGRTYIAYRLDGSSTNITIIEVQTGVEVERNAPSMWEGDRYGENDRIYTAVGVYTPEADGMHRIQNHEVGQVLWLVDYEEGDYPVQIQGGCFGVICSFCLIPLGAILWLTSRKTSQSPGLVMETAGGQQIPLAVGDSEVQQRVPTTDEIWASVHGGEPIDLTVTPIAVEEEVPPPFADRPDDEVNLPRAIDEVEEINEEISDDVKDEMGSEKQEWKSWDEG